MCIIYIIQFFGPSGEVGVCICVNYCVCGITVSVVAHDWLMQKCFKNSDVQDVTFCVLGIIGKDNSVVCFVAGLVSLIWTQIQ